MKIEAVGIVGAETLGIGLAEAMLLTGRQVRIYDVFKGSLKTALAKLDWALTSSGRRELLPNLEIVQDISKLSGADIIIETATRDEDERVKFFEKLGETVQPSCVVAASAGIIPVTPLAAAFPNPGRFVGFHFLEPVRKSRLVELIRTEQTGDDVLETCINFIGSLEKTPITVKDNPGAMVERLLRPFILNGMRLLETGKGLPHEIDGAVRKIGGLPLGPLETADLLGLDRDLASSRSVYDALGRPDRLAPANVGNRLTQYGHLGKKTTAGFYLYEDGEIVGENPALQGIVKYLGLKSMPPEEVFGKVMRPVIEEARFLASEVMASELEIETTAKLGLGWPKGPFAFLREREALLGRESGQPASEWSGFDA
ncbi:MAG: 3-hydroxyacyl-CoA dehydrogenase family protein [bacterium]